MTRTINVVHVDDDPSFLQLAAEHVHNEYPDIQMHGETDPPAALERLDSYDCVVSDYDTPGTDGLEFLQEVRDRNPDIPFIMFTGEGNEDIASEAISAGVTDYLRKQTGRSQYRVLANRIRNYAEDYWRERELKESEDYRLGLYTITSSTSFSLEDKIQRLLQLGADRLGLPNGWITEIHPDDNYYRFVEVEGPLENEYEDKEVDLDTTYCRKVIVSDELLGFNNTLQQGWSGDPAQEIYDFGAYIGSKLMVDDELHGTLCFADKEPRTREFSHPEKIFVELIGRWISYTLERNQHEQELRKERNKFKALYTNTSDAVLQAEIQDGEPVIRDANPAFTELFGVTQEDAVGKPVGDVIKTEDGVRDYFLESETSAVIECETPEGKRDVLLRVVPYTDDVVYGVHTELTE